MRLFLADISMMIPVIRTFRLSSPLGRWYSRICIGVEFEAMIAGDGSVSEIVEPLCDDTRLLSTTASTEVPRGLLTIPSFSFSWLHIPSLSVRHLLGL